MIAFKISLFSITLQIITHYIFFLSQVALTDAKDHIYEISDKEVNIYF